MKKYFTPQNEKDTDGRAFYDVRFFEAGADGQFPESFMEEFRELLPELKKAVVRFPIEPIDPWLRETAPHTAQLINLCLKENIRVYLVTRSPEIADTLTHTGLSSLELGCITVEMPDADKVEVASALIAASYTGAVAVADMSRISNFQRATAVIGSLLYRCTKIKIGTVIEEDGYPSQAMLQIDDYLNFWNLIIQRLTEHSYLTIDNRYFMTKIEVAEDFVDAVLHERDLNFVLEDILTLESEGHISGVAAYLEKNNINLQSYLY